MTFHDRKPGHSHSIFVGGRELICLNNELNSAHNHRTTTLFINRDGVIVSKHLEWPILFPDSVKFHSRRQQVWCGRKSQFLKVSVVKHDTGLFVNMAIPHLENLDPDSEI